jgi:predicted TPR repeat methyltransferase
MLAQARARGLYRELACADVAEHLHATAARHDLVFAADVFVYVGDLEHIFAGVRRVIEPGGVFAFTVERSDGAQDFELRASLRYAHAEGYLRALAGRHAMPLRHLEPGALREDQGRAVQGLYVVLAAA